MTKRFILVTTILMFLMAIGANADLPTNVQNLTNAQAYYSFDVDAKDASVYGRNASVYGATQTSTNCVLGGCYEFDGTNDYIDLGWGNSDQLAAYANMQYAGTICSWVSLDTYTTRMVVFDRSGFRPGIRFNGDSNDEYFIYLDDESTPNVYPSGSFGGTIANDTWHHMCGTWSSSSGSNPAGGDGYGRVYFDGVEIALDNPDTFTEGIDSTTSNSDWIMGKLNSDPLWWIDGQLDEVVLYDFPLNLTDVNYLYNSGAGQNPYAVPAPDPQSGSINMSIPEPLNGTQHNTLSLSLNTTINSSVQYNVTLYVNGLVNQTILDRAASQNKFIAFNLTWANTTEVTFNYSIFAYGNESLANATSTTNTIHIDNLRPGITFNVPTNTNSTVLKAGKTLNTNITLEDTNLFSFQYNITALINGSVVYTNSSSSLTGSTTYNVLDQVTFSDAGRYEALIRVCDGHTGAEINFTAEIISDEIVAEEVVIALDDKTDTQDIDLIEKEDRYNFEFETYASSTTKEFIVESDKYVHIVGSEYEGHLITGEKWIDFETDDLKSVTITRVSDYIVLVVVEKYSATDQWDFESIGELNCRKLARGLFVFAEQALTPVDNNQILSGDNTTFTLELNYNSTFMSGLEASVVYNGTSYPMTVTNTTNVSTFTRTINVLTSTNQNLSWYINYNVSGQNFSTTPRTQEVLIPIIEICPSVLSGNVQTINFTILDENTGGGYNDTTFDFALDYHNGDYTASLNGNASGAYTYAFCMFPKFAEVQTDITLQFDSATSGIEARDYEDEGVSLTNTTQYINLYLLAGATEITFHVVDGEDSNLVGVLIKAYKHDLATGTVILVEAESTDISGSAILNLAQSSTYYSFGLSQEGVLKVNTSIGKIFLTSYDFVIKEEIANAMADYLDIFSFLNSNLTYSNTSNTGYFNWTYTGSRNLEFCLRVTANDTVFHYSCSNSNASSLGFAVPTLNLTYTFQSSVNGSSSVIATLIVDTARTLYQIVGANTAWILILFIFLTMSLIGLVDKSIAIVGGMVGLIGINMFGILPAGLGWAFTIGGVAIGAIALYVVNRT